MVDILRPAAEWELQSMLGKLADHNLAFEVVGGGSLRAIGRPSNTGVAITTASLRGISLYEPTELVMSARAGTPVSEIEATLAANGQMLAFEPIDLALALGGEPGMRTIGGVFATNLSGARRISAGAARDNLLGVSAVNGRGELFKSGGRVMKNVTGLDVSRALTGSWGTLAILTDVTFKVQPLPEATATLIYPGLTDDIAIECMTAAMASPFEVSGATHLSSSAAARLQRDVTGLGVLAATCLRLENFYESVSYRSGRLKQALKIYGTPLELDAYQSARFWSEMRKLAPVPFGDSYLWRISTAPTKAAGLVAQIAKVMPVTPVYDWAGGLIWLEVLESADAGASDIRRAVAVHGGHAMLVRAPPFVRSAVDVFEPMSLPIERITRGLKSAFDPNGLLNPGRMYATV